MDTVATAPKKKPAQSELVNEFQKLGVTISKPAGGWIGIRGDAKFGPARNTRELYDLVIAGKTAEPEPAAGVPIEDGEGAPEGREPRVFKPRQPDEPEELEEDIDRGTCPLCKQPVEGDIFSLDTDQPFILPELEPDIPAEHVGMAKAILRRYHIVLEMNKLAGLRDKETELIDGLMHKHRDALIKNDKGELVYPVGDVEGVLATTTTEKVHTRKRTVPKND